MADLTITLKGAAADKVRKLVAERQYAGPEDAISDAIDALADDEIEVWLRDIVAERADAHDPGRAMTPDQVRAALRR